MDELHKEYTLLFNGITDTIRQLDRARSRLVKLQQEAEELYLARINPQGEAPPRASGGQEEPG